MILACDGIWNFMSSQEVVDYIEARIHTTPDNKLSNICEEVRPPISYKLKKLKFPTKNKTKKLLVKILFP